MTTHKKALFVLYAAFATIALNGVAAKSIGLDAISITQLRCVIGGSLMALVLGLWQGSLALSQPRLYPKALLLGCLMTIHWVTFFKGMMVSTVAIGILAHYTYPIITVTLEPLLTQKRPALADIAIALVVLLGAGIMVPQWGLNSQYVAGLGFGLISATTFSLRNIFQRHWLQQESSTRVMLIQVSTVAVLLSPWLDWSGALALDIKGWAYLMFLGVVSTAMGHTLIAYGLRHVSAKTTGLIGCLQPPLAIVFAWLILGETPELQTFIGGSIILCAALYESIQQHTKSKQN